MLEARSVALVGASPRAGSFGQRMVTEVSKSPAAPRIFLVNPQHEEIGGIRCHRSLADLPGPVDLVLLGVPDAVLDEQLTLAARRGDRSAVIFGNAYEPPPPSAPPPSARADVAQTADSQTADVAQAADGQAADSQADSQRADCQAADSPAAGRQSPGAQAPAGQADVGQASGARMAGGRPVLRARLAATAQTAGMAVCGAGCMGFVNVTHGLRAIGYVEPDPLPSGPIALITHSGSVFSALLRTRRRLGFTLAVSSGQEIVTTAAAYAEYALGRPETRVLALVLEAIREPARLRQVLSAATARDIPVVLLTAGGSAAGRAMVAAHSGALAARDGGWEALADAHGVHRVSDLAEMADTLELFAIGRRATPPTAHGATPPPTRNATPPTAHSAAQPAGRSIDPPAGRSIGRRGIATVHDSGLERAHVADLADGLDVPFAEIGDTTLDRLAGILDAGLEPSNPLDVWGTGAHAQRQLTESLLALADDPAVAVVALAVDLVPELDADESYPRAVLDAMRHTSKPLAVLSNVPSAVDPGIAADLRSAGVPVLEGTRSGLLALRHLLEHSAQPGRPDPPPVDRARQRRWAGRLGAQAPGAPLLFDLLRDYGIAAAKALPAGSADEAAAAAAGIGYPVVLKTGEPGIAHKSEVGGVLPPVGGPAALRAAYQDLSARLGPRVLVCEAIGPGTELALGMINDPDLGPLVVVGAGGVLVELLADRAVALPPVSRDQAAAMTGRLRVAALLAGVRGQPGADLRAVADAITGLSAIACELGGELEALDINPLICGPGGAVAVDALAVPRGPAASG
jgi:acetate---CoA ligase (ADP-forming)